MMGNGEHDCVDKDKLVWTISAKRWTWKKESFTMTDVRGGADVVVARVKKSNDWGKDKYKLTVREGQDATLVVGIMTAIEADIDQMEKEAREALEQGEEEDRNVRF